MVNTLALTPDELLEQCELGAAVLPHFAPSTLAVQFGRGAGICAAADFNAEQVASFTVLYWQRRLRFAWPGDFSELPAFLTGPTRTVLIPVEKIERIRHLEAVRNAKAREFNSLKTVHREDDGNDF